MTARVLNLKIFDDACLSDSTPVESDSTRNRDFSRFPNIVSFLDIANCKPDAPEDHPEEKKKEKIRRDGN